MYILTVNLFLMKLTTAITTREKNYTICYICVAIKRVNNLEISNIVYVVCK